VVEKLIRKVEADPDAFRVGVEITPKDVIKLAIDAEDIFAEAMRVVIANKLRAAGLKDFGTTADWKRITGEKAGRWAPGVRAAEAKIRKKFATIIPETYRAASEARKLPKGPKGSAANKARMIKYFDERVRLARERKGIR